MRAQRVDDAFPRDGMARCCRCVAVLVRTLARCLELLPAIGESWSLETRLEIGENLELSNKRGVGWDRCFFLQTLASRTPLVNIELPERRREAAGQGCKSISKNGLVHRGANSFSRLRLQTTTSRRPTERSRYEWRWVDATVGYGAHEGPRDP